MLGGETSGEINGGAESDELSLGPCWAGGHQAERQQVGT